MNKDQRKAALEIFDDCETSFSFMDSGFIKDVWHFTDSQVKTIREALAAPSPEVVTDFLHEKLREHSIIVNGLVEAYLKKWGADPKKHQLSIKTEQDGKISYAVEDISFREAAALEDVREAINNCEYHIGVLANYADEEATHEIDGEKAVVVPVDQIYMAQSYIKEIKEKLSAATSNECQGMVEALLKQIEINDYQDSAGHALKMNKAYLDLAAHRNRGA